MLSNFKATKRQELSYFSAIDGGLLNVLIASLIASAFPKRLLFCQTRSWKGSKNSMNKYGGLPFRYDRSAGPYHESSGQMRKKTWRISVLSNKQMERDLWRAKKSELYSNMIPIVCSSHSKFWIIFFTFKCRPERQWFWSSRRDLKAKKMPP